jgi:hypothetical protein
MIPSKCDLMELDQDSNGRFKNGDIQMGPSWIQGSPKTQMLPITSQNRVLDVENRVFHVYCLSVCRCVRSKVDQQEWIHFGEWQGSGFMFGWPWM